MDAIEYIDIKLRNLYKGVEDANADHDILYIYMCRQMIKVFNEDKKDLITKGELNRYD